jgi:ribosomal protein RSM22 (predicted rRNA methylase)
LHKLKHARIVTKSIKRKGKYIMTAYEAAELRKSGLTPSQQSKAARLIEKGESVAQAIKTIKDKANKSRGWI